MKKMMSLFVCLSLLLSMGCMLGGCNSEQKKLVGTWQSEINYAPVVNTIIYSADSMKGVGDYFKLDSYTLLTTFTFWDDGTYTITVDPMEVFQSAQQIRNNMVNGMEQYLSDLIKEAGLNISPSA